MEAMEYIKIPVRTKGGGTVYALVDGDYDGEYFAQFKWYLSPLGYAIRPTYANLDDLPKNRKVYLHREVLKVEPPYEVDHIDGDKLNNRSCNLRAATHRQNTWNRRRISKGLSNSGYIGVYRQTWGRYTAYIQREYLGAFDSAIEAARAYDDEARKRYGEYAQLNFTN